jgi:tetratricopeptide (TPR) repeat protein
MQMSEENSLGEMLNTAIRRMGWTHQQVADKFDPAVNRVTVSRWVRDFLRPSDYHLKQLVAILGLNEEEAYALFRAARLEPPKKHNLSSRNRLFTGRENCLELVAKHFKTDTTVALSGLPGIGKTQLAHEYAHRCDRTQEYSAVLWVNADKASLQSSYADLAEALQLPEQDERELYNRVQAVTQWLKRHKNWLLIMDNVDDLELARSFFPDAHRGHILLTTRTQIVGGIARQIEIEKMEPEDAQLFLLRRSRVLDVKAKLDTVATNVHEAARQIVELLDGHPLALDQAGAFIEDRGSFTTYKDLYDKQRRDLLDRRGSLKGADCDYPVTVAVTFTLCFNMARTQHPLADDILNFCAFLHPDAIPEELFQHDDSFKLDTLAFTDGITALLQYSLIARNTQDETYSLHRLVQAVLIDGMLQDLKKQWRERVVRGLCLAFLQSFTSSTSSGEWTLCERLLPHVLACARWTEDELASTTDIAWVFHMSSLLLHNRGQLSEAAALLERVFSIYERHLASDHPDVARVLNDLAVIYSNQGRKAEAVPLFQDAYEIWANCLKKAARSGIGLDSADDLFRGVSESAFNLGVIYLHQDAYEDAELFLRQALLVQEKLFGSEHPDVARSLYMLALLYHRQGNYEQGGVFAQQAIRIWEKSEHPDIAFPIIMGANIAELLHQYDLAEAFYQQALHTQEQQLGEGHPEVQAIKKAYEEFLQSIGRDDEPSE